MDSLQLLRESGITLQQIPAIWLSSHASRRKVSQMTFAFLIVLPLLLYLRTVPASFKRLKFHSNDDARQRQTDSVQRDKNNKTRTPINVLSIAQIPKPSGFSHIISKEQTQQHPARTFHTNGLGVRNYLKFGSAKQRALVFVNELSQTPFGSLLKAVEMYKIHYLNGYNGLTHNNNGVPDVTRETIHWSCVLKCIGSDGAYVIFLKCREKCKDWIIYDRTGFFRYLGVCVGKLLFFFVCSIILVAIVSFIATVVLEALQFI